MRVNPGVQLGDGQLQLSARLQWCVISAITCGLCVNAQSKETAVNNNTIYREGHRPTA